MKVLVEIKDNKAEFLLELLNSFSFVKTKTLTAEKAAFLEDLKEAVDQVNLVKQGKTQGRSLSDLVNEL